MAADLNQDVSGTTTATISLSVPVAAAFGAGFAPTGVASQSTGGKITALSTSANWTLSVKDYGTDGTDGDGTMDSLAQIAGVPNPLCTNSAPELAQPIAVSVAPSVLNAAIATTSQTLTGSNQVVAQNTSTLLPLTATIFNTTFSQTIGQSEAVKTGCAYTIKAAYTLS
jgi:hypothetical protein